MNGSADTVYDIAVERLRTLTLLCTLYFVLYSVEYSRVAAYLNVPPCPAGCMTAQLSGCVLSLRSVEYGRAAAYLNVSPCPSGCMTA